MKLFHGSNMEIQNPNLNMSRKSLDFGTGFYLTSDMEQAEKWAKRVSKTRNLGTPVVSVFEIDENIWKKLNILKFDYPNEEWLDTIVQYRTNQNEENNIDVIIGPIADDRTIDVINQYISKTFSKKIAIELLLPMKLKDQWVFKTDSAISALSFKEGIKL